MTNHKVVINNCFGGFGITLKCVQTMAEMGHEKAIEILNHKDFTGKKEPRYQGYTVGDYKGFYPRDLYDNRHDPILIKAIEKIGTKEASDECAELLVCEIEGNQYDITDYDGWETLVTPEGKWRTIKPCGIKWSYE